MVRPAAYLLREIWAVTTYITQRTRAYTNNAGDSGVIPLGWCALQHGAARYEHL